MLGEVWEDHSAVEDGWTASEMHWEAIFEDYGQVIGKLKKQKEPQLGTKLKESSMFFPLNYNH